jgi:small nuclear ribonucleoprotein (snRNP)-like protein
MTVVLIILVDLPAVPLITNVSAGSTYITITWEKELSGALHWYELEYNFTIRDCKNYTGEGKEVISGHLSNYTLRNSSETPVEEDSIYNIFLTAVNSDGRSEANVTEITTLKNGICLVFILP